MKHYSGYLQKKSIKIEPTTNHAGFSPKDMWQKQHAYYLYILWKKQGIIYDTKLYEKLIDVIHSLWIRRNSFKYDRWIHGLREVKYVGFKTAVITQYKIWNKELKTSDRYLFNKIKLKVWTQKGEHTIARGYYQELKKNLKRARERNVR